MTVATETKKSTTKHFVDLFALETIVKRKRIVIEAPTHLNEDELVELNGETLARLADEYGCDADWEFEEADGWEQLGEIHVSGPVPDDIKPDIVFRFNKAGDLIEVGSGDPAVFTF